MADRNAYLSERDEAMYDGSGRGKRAGFDERLPIIRKDRRALAGVE